MSNSNATPAQEHVEVAAAQVNVRAENGEVMFVMDRPLQSFSVPVAQVPQLVDSIARAAHEAQIQALQFELAQARAEIAALRAVKRD